VCNMAVKIGGIRPMGARAWVIPEPVVVLRTSQYQTGTTVTLMTELIISS